MSSLLKHLTASAFLAGSSVLLVACGAAPGAASASDRVALAAVPSPAHAAAETTAASATATTAATSSAATPAHLPLIRVHKSPSCGCCGVWVEHVRAAGFPVEVHDTEDMMTVKDRLGVPEPMMSCHTAEVDGYFVEGHVPAEDIKRLLAEKPKARGIAVPGMPLGSPGMEMPDGRTQPYEVALVGGDGTTGTFSRHP
ncbi:DUF411 domain-containing protein [Pseudoxanthomonas sp. 22568]|uniref:DUF411 domain-containing protein n=1 Tax=Pseudoxanthomonas sp. 22568 TaxID=3453945 RepID=UPI003F82C1EE